MERSSTLHLLVILLCFSHFIFLNAAPLSRIRRLSQGPRNLHVSGDSNEGMAEERWEEIEVDTVEGRMDFEIKNDYQGVGANNHHTPKPPAAWVRTNDVSADSDPN